MRALPPGGGNPGFQRLFEIDECFRFTSRFQDELVRLNAGWLDLDAAAAPDGDADLDFHNLPF